MGSGRPAPAAGQLLWDWELGRPGALQCDVSLFFPRRGESAGYALLKYMKEFQYAIKEIIGKDVDAKDFILQPLWDIVNVATA